MKANHEQANIWERLDDLATSRRNLDLAIRDVVRHARCLGVSWSRIGTALEMTAEGARRKYKEPS